MGIWDIVSNEYTIFSAIFYNIIIFAVITNIWLIVTLGYLKFIKLELIIFNKGVQI